MRALWKGTISLGLVTIPVSLYPATKREELRFRLLRKSDLSPVNYKRVAEVPWDQADQGERRTHGGTGTGGGGVRWNAARCDCYRYGGLGAAGSRDAGATG